MLKTGKLDSELLEKIVFDNIKYKRPEILERPGIGEDCAVIDYGSYECVMSTDPITAAISQIGRLAIHISCNDIASNGIQPLGIMLAVMLPEGTTKEQIEEMMAQAGRAAEKMGVEIIGGHTEITKAVNQPVIVSTAIGRGTKGASQSGREMKPGDHILMTKWAGLEGTGVIACDFERELRAVLSEAEIKKAQGFLDHISVVKEGVIAGNIGTAGMHDVTEGGILGAVWEMASVGKVGAEVRADMIPVDEVTLKICKHFGMDPLRLISSGCMMIIAADGKKEEIMEAIKDAGIEISCIGQIKLAGDGIRIDRGDGLEEIAPPDSDEIYKAVK